MSIFGGVEHLRTFAPVPYDRRVACEVHLRLLAYSIFDKAAGLASAFSFADCRPKLDGDSVR
jgi:hypothetical protein